MPQRKKPCVYAAIHVLIRVLNFTSFAVAFVYGPKYHSNEELQKALEDLTLKYPENAFMYSIGKSEKGVELWVIAIASHTPDNHVFLRPEVKYVGNMHGDEAVGRELIIRFADYLLSHRSNPEVQRLLDNSRVHLLPSINPDGFANSVEGMCETITADSRGNANKLDLNRNFPDIWRHNKAEIQPETRAIMDWLDRIPFVLSANFHGGAKVINYPYDSNPESERRYSIAPDDDFFRHLAVTYVSNQPAIKDGCSDDWFIGGITNGAAWYTLTGGMQDYNYGFYGVLETTFELSCCKYPDASQLSKFWQRNRIPMLKYLLEVNRGIRGVITDENNNGIKAKLHIKGRNNTFYSTENGEYWRLLLPGSYTLQVQAQGYPETEMDFHISESNALIVKNLTVSKTTSGTTKEIKRTFTINYRVSLSVRTTLRAEHSTLASTAPSVTVESEEENATEVSVDSTTSGAETSVNPDRKNATADEGEESFKSQGISLTDTRLQIAMAMMALMLRFCAV